MSEGIQDEMKDYIQHSALLLHVSHAFFVICYIVLSS